MTQYLRNVLHFAVAGAVVLTMGCGDTSSDAPSPAETAPGQTAPTGEMAPPQGADVQKVNLNTASEEEFLEIPGVGEQMAHEFDEYRPYVSIQQFRQEIGKYVDEEQVAAYEEHVFVPVSPNESDAETLMQLPGVDADAASELAAARPYDSNEAFLERLAEHVSASEADEAEAYLASP